MTPQANHYGAKFTSPPKPNQQYISVTKNYSKVLPSSYISYQTQTQPSQLQRVSQPKLSYNNQQFTQAQPKITSIHVYNKIPTAGSSFNKPSMQAATNQSKTVSLNFKPINQTASNVQQRNRMSQQQQQRQQEKNVIPNKIPTFNLTNPKSILSKNQAQYDSFTSLSDFSEYSRHDSC